MNDDAGNVGSLQTGRGARSQMESSGGGICVACGSTVSFGGPDGGCLNCLAQFALSPDDEPDDGETAAPARVFGHFEIVSGPDGWPVKLGRGAMGVTYRARDTVLRSEVALKVINVNVAGHPASRAAFLWEARAAARLRHPNVASVFHYGEQDGECFYVMELVEGETLEARVRREGPLPPALVLEVGRQVACALIEAEALSMVHRDLKPSNLMFASRSGDGAKDPPHLKVIDFGLAQAAELAEAEDGEGTTPGGFVGTPAFASPEQSARDHAHPVDTRSDIYSLGVTLWFLLSGKLPFDGQTLTAIGGQQTERPLPLTHLSAAKTPTPVSILLQRMLKADPDERPQSARELLDDLQRCQDRLKGARAKGWIRALLLAAILCIGVLVTLVFRQTAAPGPGSPRPATPPDRSIAVLPFENLSPEGADAFFTTGIQDQITADLGRVAALRVTGPESARAYPPPDPGKGRDLAPIGRELGVRYLLEGSAWRAGEHLSVTVRLVDPHDPRHPWSKQYERRLAEVFAVQGEITRAVVERLQVNLSAQEKAAVNRPPTGDLTAYDLYLRAMAVPRVVVNGDPDVILPNLRRKLPLLEQAIARDPDFVLALCELARTHDQIHFHRSDGPAEEPPVDHRSLSETALAKARRLQPDAGEVHLAQAAHALQINRDVEQAHLEIDLARRRLPHNAQVEEIAARVARRQDRWEEAVRSLEQTVALEPRDIVARDLLVSTYQLLRRHEEMDRILAGRIALTPPAEAHSLRLDQAGIAMVSRADLGPWRAEYAAQAAAGVLNNMDREAGAVFLALLSHDAGALSGALDANNRDVYPIAGVAYPKAWFEALAARLRGDGPGARTAFAAARPTLERQVLADPTEGILVGALAMIDAGMGRKEEAIAGAKRACELSSYERYNLDAPVVRCNLAVVYAWTGEPDLALAELEKLVGRPAGNGYPTQPTYGDFRLNPVWDPLRADPRFEALVQRLAPKPTR